MVFMKRVSVPAFVNPHLFWIFEVETTQQRNVFQKKLKESLNKPTEIKAQQGELVIIFDNKAWKRAEVINVFDENYDCWLIDYGSLCKTTSVYQLPGEFTVTPAMVHVACLNNIIELSTVLEIESGSQVHQEVVSFSHGLSSLINAYIFQADSIVFQTQRVIDHVLCGQLELTKNGVSYSLVDKLLKEKRITVNGDLFREAFKVNNQDVMLSHKYKVCVAQVKQSRILADDDVGIGRGYKRGIVSKQPGLQSTSDKNFVQAWVDESKAQLMSNHKQCNLIANACVPSTSLNVANNSDKIYENADEIAPELLENKIQKSVSDSSFEEIEAKEIYLRCKNTIKSENDVTTFETGSISFRSKSKLNHTLESISDDYFKTIEDNDYSGSKSKLKHLHGSIDDEFFESVDDKKPVETENDSSFRQDDQKSPNQKTKMALAFEKYIDDDPFRDSDEDLLLKKQLPEQKSEENSKQSSVTKQNIKNDPFSDSDEDLSKKLEKSDGQVKSLTTKHNISDDSFSDSTSLKKIDKIKSESEMITTKQTDEEYNASSQIRSKLHGLNIFPAGSQLTNKKTKKRKVTSKAPSTSGSSASQKSKHKATGVLSKDVLLNKNTSSNASSDLAVKNKPDEVSNTASSDSDSECAPEPCKKNLFTFGCCKCENCRMWNEDDIAGEFNEFKDTRNAMKREMTKPSLLFKDENIKDTVEIKTKKFKGNTTTKIERDIEPTLLVHGYCIPAPASKINDVPFNTSVLRALTKLKFSIAKTIQSYAWPALMRQMNICMVHGPGTGKTMAYLPAIFSYILESPERYSDLPKATGPVAVILCKGIRKVEEIFTLFCNFRAQVGKKLNISCAVSPLDNSYLKTIKSSDVVVATPGVLITLLKRRVLTLKRLCHFIVEETDEVLDKFPQEFDDLTSVVQSMLEHRSCIYSVQVVLCSEHWTVSLEKFLKRLCSTPLVCIGAYLESALYGRADIQMHFVPSKIKLSMLCDILKQKSHANRTVIVCNEEDEIDVLEEHFRIKGVSVASVKSTMKSEEMLEVELMWENTVCGKHAALICTDALLHGHLSITNANVLVHYSLPPESWTQFSRRFKCLVDSYESPFNSKCLKNKCQVHVFIDEECTKQFPRLYNFLHSMGVKISEKFSELCKKIKETDELQKIKSHIKLCPIMKLFGTCNKVNCKKRHLLSQEDISTTLPQNGLIKFKLTAVHDVSVYTIHLIEHTGIDDKVHKYPENTDFGLKLSQAVKEYKVYAKNPTLGGLFAWFDAENNAYHRCEITRILSENQITKLADDVHVKFIDTGCIKKTTTALLFELPESYKSMPAQGIEVYLANLLPPDRDTEWSFSMKHTVEKILKDAEYQKSGVYFTGRIVLQVDATLWLEDVVLLEDLSFSNETVTKLLLKKSLLHKQLVSHSPEQLSHLYNACKSVGIILCNYECKPTQKVTMHKVKEQVKPQWAHLDEENLNAVYFCSGISPHLFYVRLEKYYGLFQKLQNELQKLINQPHYPDVKEITVGKCYLVKDPSSEEFCRVIVTKIQDETAECFFVDFGDEACVFKNEIKHLPDACITQLPFQAIECKLFGISPPLEVWADEATDVLYQYCFEPKTDDECDAKSDIFRTLYISTLSVIKSGFSGCRNYSVLLVDYYSKKPVLINKILIDCGFALPVEDISLDNIVLPECQDYNDEQEDDDLHINDEKDVASNEMKDQEAAEKSPSPSEDENIWDIEINDAEEFLFDFMGINKMKNTKPKEKLQFDEAPAPIGGYPMKALPPANHHTPDLTWYQTGKHIKVDIKLPNVTEYALHILRKRIFTFSTISRDKEYKLNFQLFDDVEKTFQHSSGGLVIRVTLEKSNGSVEWPRLTKSEQKFRYIKYDVSKCSLPEEKKRLFLEIDRNEKDDNDNTDNYFVFGSDEDYSESDIESDSSGN